MVASLIAAAVTFVMAVAPAVTTVCEGMCAERENGRTTGEHHSCHQRAFTLNETGITSGAHICGHSDEGPSAVGQSLWLLAAPALIVHAFTFAPPSLDAPRFDGGSDHGPPLVSPRSTQLRI